MVITEDFSRSLGKRLVSDINKVLTEIDACPSHVSIVTAHITTVDKTGNKDGKGKHVKKSVEETQHEKTKYWKRLVDGKGTGVC